MEFYGWSDSSCEPAAEQGGLRSLVPHPLAQLPRIRKIIPQRNKWWYKKKGKRVLNGKKKKIKRLEQSTLQNSPSDLLTLWIGSGRLVNVWNNWKAGRKPLICTIGQILWCKYSSKANVKATTLLYCGMHWDLGRRTLFLSHRYGIWKLAQKHKNRKM